MEAAIQNHIRGILDELERLQKEVEAEKRPARALRNLMEANTLFKIELRSSTKAGHLQVKAHTAHLTEVAFETDGQHQKLSMTFDSADADAVWTGPTPLDLYGRRG